MIRRTLLGAALGCLLAIPSPPGARAQAFEFDTATARKLLHEADQALLLSDSLRFDRRFQESLSSLFRAWGLERALPPEVVPPDRDATMDSIVRVSTVEEAFQAAGALDAGDHWRWHRQATYRALERQGRLAEALDFAFREGDLPGNMAWIVGGLDNAQVRYAAVRRWMAEAPLSDEQRGEILVEVLLWQVDWDFWASWKEADEALPPESRVWVHLNALPRTFRPRMSEADSLAGVVLAEIEDLSDQPSRDHYLGILNSYCSTVELPSCEVGRLPIGEHTPSMIRTTVINRMMRGDWDQAVEAIDRYRGLATPVQVAAAMAEGLASARPNCAMRMCSQRVLDSLVTAWLPELERMEALNPGAPGDTVRAHLARLWGDRDARKAAELIRGITDKRLQAWTLIGPIQSAFGTDVWGTLELARLARDIGSPFPLAEAYVLMMRLGEPGLAREMLEMHPEGGWERVDNQLRWARALLYAGRWSEAREVARAAYGAWDPGRYPVLGINHLSVLGDLDLVEEVVAWARGLDVPDARAGGIASVLASFSGSWMGR